MSNWTDERTELLKKLWDDGLWVSAIEAQLGVSRGSITGKIHRLGLPPRKAGSHGSYKWGKANNGATRKPIPPKVKKPGRLTGIIATTGHGGHKSRPDYITSSRGLDGENHSTAGRAGPALTGVWEPPEAAHGDGCRAGPRETSSPAKGKRLLDLKSDECHWAINERHGFDEHLFCGAEIEPDSPHEKYCKAHARRAGSGYGGGGLSRRLKIKCALRRLEAQTD